MRERRMKIMIADDDTSVRTGIGQILEEEGYLCCYAGDGLDVLAKIGAEKPDLLILDVMMPGINGFDVCQQLRTRGELLPIIMLSAKGDFVDKSVGMRCGADDYMVKPFDAAELCMHIRANLSKKRTSREFELWLKPERTGMMRMPQSGEQDMIEVGDLRIYLNRYEAFLRGKKVNLTGKEFEILAFMASHPGEVFTREQILNFLWGEDNSKDLNTVTVFIRKIREKIEDDPPKPRYILTVWRVGYKFCQE